MEEKQLKELLRQKLDRMPIITQKLRKVVSKKDNRIWYILETRIISFYSAKQMAKLIAKGSFKSASEIKVEEEDIF